MRWILGLVATLLALVVLAVVALFVLGLRPGAGRVEAAVDIARPAPEVYTWVTESEKLKQWVGWLVAVEREDGERRVGSREVWVMDDPNLKERMRIPFEVTALEENRLVRVHVSDPGAFEGDSEYRIEDRDGSTRLSCSSAFRYTHPLARLMEPLVTPQAQKKLEKDLARLRELMETGVAPASRTQPSSRGRPSLSTRGRSCANTRPSVA